MNAPKTTRGAIFIGSLPYIRLARAVQSSSALGSAKQSSTSAQTAGGDGIRRILSHDGIIVMDARGTIAIFNSACERLFGYRPEDNVKMLVLEPCRSSCSRVGATSICGS